MRIPVLIVSAVDNKWEQYLAHFTQWTWAELLSNMKVTSKTIVSMDEEDMEYLRNLLNYDRENYVSAIISLLEEDGYNNQQN